MQLLVERELIVMDACKAHDRLEVIGFPVVRIGR